MLNRFTDYYFWFAQPSTILDQADKFFLYFFGALLIASIIFFIFAKLIKNPVDKKLFKKFWNLFFTISISGLIWFGVRFENAPILGRRYWVALTLIIGLIWLLFIIKYLIFNYKAQRLIYSKEQIKNKYLPKAK